MPPSGGEDVGCKLELPPSPSFKCQSPRPRVTRTSNNRLPSELAAGIAGVKDTKAQVVCVDNYR